MTPKPFVYEVPYDTIDDMLVERLKEIRNFYLNDIQAAREGTQWMHEEDIKIATIKYIPACEDLLDYFGIAEQDWDR